LTPELKILRSKKASQGSYQRLNSKFSTLPRGMGFGGTVEGFRLFIPESLEHCRVVGACPTYETGRLLGSTAAPPGVGPESETFEIQTMEIWGCGGAEVVAAALRAQATEREIADENVTKARQVDRAAFFNNDFDKEFFLSKTTAHSKFTERDRGGNA
jgi:hypothetical protein